MMISESGRDLQQLDTRQVLLDNLLDEHVEDHLYACSVCGGGEVVVHRPVQNTVTHQEHGSDVVGCSIHVIICS